MKTNMMKMKDFRCILIPVLLLTGACTALPRTEGWLEGNPVTVSLSMGVSSFGHAGMAGAGADTGAADAAAFDATLQNSAGTRSTSPHTYEVENLIHDIWLIQFNSRGQYVNASYYPREGLAGQVIENESFELMSLSESTVCIVANTMNPDLSWPDNLPAFKRTLLDVGANNELALDRMPMCGYWIGDVTADLSLSVILSRMMTRINLVINNNTGQRLSGIRAELEHIPAKAYVYPQARQEALPADAYLDEAFTDEDTGTMADGESWLLYHYIAPNICSGAENATTLKITSGGMEWNVALGNNSPSSSQRNYTLYANNYYTFTLNLGPEQRMAAGEDSVKYSELKRETVKGKGL